VVELPVFYETRRVGTIETHEDGPSFVYEPEWLRTRGAFPLSILMPLSPRRTSPQIFEPWAANLLPEASQLRTVARMLGAAPEDTIAILAEIGRDTAGALSIGKPGSADPGGWVQVPNDAALERIINELPSKPFLVGEDGVSMSLAGVQSKLGVALNTGGQICIPHDGAPSTHILKPDSDNLFGGVQNEALCLVLAGRCGLNASRVTTGKAGKRTYLLVTRYDRLEQTGRWRRLHQEDFCQALGKPPSAKYEVNQSGIKGPTLADMFALTRNAMRAPDVLHLLDNVLFNVLVCNTDAHAKNYSLMISGRGFSLAPTYDVMCAAAWEGITRNLAQKIAGKNRGEHLKRRQWQAFAGDCGLNGPRLIKRLEELANAVSREVKAAEAEVDAMPAGTHALMPAFVEAIEARARAIISGLSEDKPRPTAPPTTTHGPPAKRSRRKKAKATTH
jgi:serine/threonine-protein kinase HipA